MLIKKSRKKILFRLFNIHNNRYKPTTYVSTNPVKVYF